MKLAEMPESRKCGVCKYGGMRKRYLKEHRSEMYKELLLAGTLDEHLAEIEEAAQHRLDCIIPALAKAQDVTEELKRRDSMKWVGMMNNIKAQVEEVIMAELIYT